jgi:hypothetical protein
MVPQQAQRLRWEDDVDIFLWCDKGGVFDDDESILFYLSLPQLWRTRIHFLTSILSPAPFATTVQFTGARRLFFDKLPFAFFCMLARLVPLRAIKPLNNWVRLGQCSLVIATLDGICITVELQLIDRIFWMIFLPLKNA